MKSGAFNKAPLLLILLLALVFAKLHANKRSEVKDACFNICGDARGYYAWLPAIFIYHDLNFKFYDQVEFRDSTCGCTTATAIPIQDYRYTFNGKSFDKYYPGTSFLMLPFFLTAHIYTSAFTEYKPNGYTWYYFHIMAYGAIFYYIIGMLFFLGILEKLQLSIFKKLLTIIMVTFGTNLIYYIVDAPLYSHIYSFALIAAFLYYSFSLNEQFKFKTILYLSIITGMIIITRPVNVSIILVLPFILGENLRPYLKNLIQNPYRLFCLIPVLAFPTILFILYKIAIGKYFVYSYSKEGFNFLHPNIWKFLFHYDNGVFAYMPLLALPWLLLPLWYKLENRKLIIGISITLLVTIYIHSAWWCWSYGLSFGARTILDFVPLFGIVIALSLKQTSAKRYIYLLTPYLFGCALTMILYHQKSAHHFMATYPITDYWAAIYNALGIK